jgi:uncharacterized protein (TIGR03435 family)
MTSTLFAPFLNHLWQSSVAVLAVWLLTLTMRRNRAEVRYWLWLAASVKFLIPFAVLVSIGQQLQWRTVPVITTPPQLSVMMNQFSGPVQALVPATTRMESSGTPDLLPSILMGVWLCGAALGLGHWLRLFRRMNAVRSSATFLPLDFSIPVLSCQGRVEPGVLGIWKPVLLLPEGISDRLAPTQLKAVLAHELCHVRRRDNLTGAIHILVEIVFWFHPLVWLIRARLLAERERACDEDVLRASDANAYAEGILTVCRLYLESPLAVAGVTGSNLRKRIEDILMNRPVTSIHAFKKFVLVTVGVSAVAAPIFIGVFGAQSVRAQSEPAGHLAFAAASIHENNAARGDMNLQFLPGGKFTGRRMTLAMLVAAAYDLPFQSPRLTGGPEWVYNTHFDIQAAAEEGAIPAGAPPKVRDEQIRAMLRTLVADRFKVTISRATKGLPLYAITVRNGGAKLESSSTDTETCSSQATTVGDRRACHNFSGGPGSGLHGDAVTVSDLASRLSAWADRPVIDKTGLMGLYTIQTEGWVPMRPQAPLPPGATPTAESQAFEDPSRPTLFQVLDRLGLKLEPQTGPVEIFVIQHAEQPAEN